MLNYRQLNYIFTFRYLYLTFLFIFSINIYAIHGYVSFEHSATDKDWSFLPKITNSFDYSDFSSLEIMLVHNKYVLKTNSSKFYLNLERPVEPKSLNLNAQSDLLEFIYILEPDKAFSISYKNQIADTQQIHCYTFSSLTIGFCDDALITITNSKEKYNALENNKLMLIDASNNEIKLSYIKAADNFLADEYFLYFALSENTFNWVSPIEELTSGFIANLSYKGSKIGDLVSNEIRRLPQRDKFILYKLGLNLYNDIQIFSDLDFFYEIDFVLVELEDYLEYGSVPNNNLKIESGITYKIDDISISLSATFYQNNLYGYEDISFNQRSEHHFSSNFGSLNIKFKYSF